MKLRPTQSLVKSCLLCSLVVGTEEEDPDAAAGGADEDETSDDDYVDDGDDNINTDKEDIETEWDAAKKKLEAEKEALRNLAILLLGSDSVAVETTEPESTRSLMQ